MVDIVVRTHKAEYTAGETVYGVAYLKVSRATSAAGIKIRFVGEESYYFCDGCKPRYGKRTYLSNDTYDLYNFDGPIPIGTYAVPFQKTLPREIPATCELSSRQGLEWRICVTYSVKVFLDGSSSVSDHKQIRVYQTLVCDTSVTETSKGRIPILSSDVDVCMEVKAPINYISQNVYVGITFTNKGNRKPTITAITAKLLNDIIIIFKENLHEPEPENRFSISNSFQFPSFRCSTSNQTFSQKHIRPLGNDEPSVIWKQAILNDNQCSFNNGLHDLSIPLSHNLQPTTFGTHCICLYAVQVEVNIKHCTPAVLTIPLPSIRQKNFEWINFDFPDWVESCSKLPSLCPFTVGDDILESDVFSRLPSFRTL